MGWLLDKICGLFEWLWAGIVEIFAWLVESLVWVGNKIVNNITVFATGLLATLAGVMPAETLAGTWSHVLETISWLDGWPLYVLDNCFAADEMLARISYFGGVYLAALAVRATFAAVRAVLDLL